MLTNRLSLLALAFASANAAIFSKRQYYDEAHEDALDAACRPSNSSNGVYDWNAPCNAVMSIQYECMYGPEYGNYVRHPEDQLPQHVDEDYEGPPEQPFEAQRICICQSQFRDMVAGCMSCLEKAGGIEGDDWFGASKIDPAMQSYCEAATPAAEDFANFFDKAVGGDEEMATSAFVSASATASNVLGNATDVSLYFTPSVTGSAAYIAGMPSPSSSGGNVTYTTSKTSDGQIVPTAVAGDEREASSGDSTSSGAPASSGSSGTAQGSQTGSSATASSDAGAMQTAMVQVGAFGALGVAALIAAF